MTTTLLLIRHGVTDWNAAIFPHGADREASVQRTFDFLAELARS